MGCLPVFELFILGVFLVVRVIISWASIVVSVAEPVPIAASTSRRQSARLSEMRSSDVEVRRVAMASRGLNEDDWLSSVACRWCRSRRDESRMLLCDSCGAGCHHYCGPLGTEVPPVDDGSNWLCVFCTRGENLSVWDIDSRPPPMSNMEVQTSIGLAVTASYAVSTLLYDDRIFSDFCLYIEATYGYILGRNIDFFNGDKCRRHRSECTAGYVSSLRTSDSAPLRDPFSAMNALRRAFRLNGLLVDAFGHDSLSLRVAQGLRILVPPVQQTMKVGVTETMLSLARRDALVLEIDRRSLYVRMLGLSAIYAYSAGARVSEFATTPRSNHTVTWNMVRFRTVGDLISSVEVFTRSSKTTGPGRGPKSRPLVLEFLSLQSASTAEGELSSTLSGALWRWKTVSCGLPEDPVFAFRHGSYRKTLRREDFVAYTKGLASECGLPPSNFSSKSWKVGKVSRGVLAGDSTSDMLRRGNHRSLSANRFYRPLVTSLGSVFSEGAGIPDQFARDEVERDAFLRGVPPFVRGTVDGSSSENSGSE